MTSDDDDAHAGQSSACSGHNVHESDDNLAFLQHQHQKSGMTAGGIRYRDRSDPETNPASQEEMDTTDTNGTTPAEPVSNVDGDITPTRPLFSPQPQTDPVTPSPQSRLRRSSARHSIDLSKVSPKCLESNGVQVPERRSSRSARHSMSRFQQQQQGADDRDSNHTNEHAEPDNVDDDEDADDDFQPAMEDMEYGGQPGTTGRLNIVDSSSPASSPHDGSATPPPISKPRRYIFDDFLLHDDTTLVLQPQESPPSPATVVRHGEDAEEEFRPPVLRGSSSLRSSVTGRKTINASTQFPPRPHSASANRQLEQQQEDGAVPLMDQDHLYRDAETHSRNGSSLALHLWEESSMAPKKRSGSVSSSTSRRPASFAHAPARVFNSSENTSPVPRHVSQLDPRRHTLPNRRMMMMNRKDNDRLPNFFSYSVFQTVLHNPATTHQLLKFSDNQFCSENVEFLKKIEMYHLALSDLAVMLTDIHKTFISNKSPSQINVPGYMMKIAHSEVKSVVKSTLPSMGTIFDDMQKTIEHLIFTSVYPRFVHYQLSKSASRALASERKNVYQGLGDCFCISDPFKADNPVVYASDGFVKVTGYGRPEIIPRNCRFLQGTQTDRSSIQRIAKAVAEKREVVELILNYKKSGEPFWNLLYVTPLFNETGKLAFYLGGQINCSATIHRNVDVMRVLSTSSAAEQEEDLTKPAAPSNNSPRRSSSVTYAGKLLKAFRGGGRSSNNNSRNGKQTHNGITTANTATTNSAMDSPSMERQLLDRVEGLDLDTQKQEFYTAYSKWIVARADSFVIYFYSEGVTDMLQSSTKNNHHHSDGGIVGQTIFRFLKRNMLDSHQVDVKSRVRSSIRAGYPTCLDLRLQTRRSAIFRGDELFKTYWTPMKDENALTQWVVVTLVPAMM